MPAVLGLAGINGTDESEVLRTSVYFADNYFGDGTDSVQILGHSIDGKGGDDLLIALDFPYLAGGGFPISIGAYLIDFDAYGFTLNGMPAGGGTIAASFYGGAGNDILNGGNRNDYLYGNDDNDTLFGEGGNDNLMPGAGNDTAYGGYGADTFLTYLEGSDSLYGELGDDLFWVDANNAPGGAMMGIAIMDGGGGTDTLRVSGGLHLDQVTLVNVEVLDIQGGPVYGTVGKLGYFGLITSSAGSSSQFNFWLQGAGGTLDLSTRVEGLHSVLVHGEGLTSGLTLTGTSNRDWIIGSAYDDVLKGNGSDLGADRLEGDAGNDTIHSGGQNDDLVGGAGIDTVSYATATGGVTVSLASYNDQYTGGAGIDLLNSFENLTGSSYADTLTGSAGDNVLSGRAGNDTLNAGAGNDTLDGGAGADTMAGGSGIDVYFVDNAGDQVIEAVGGGSDTVFATANFALGAGQEIETLRVRGSAGLALTGNELANYLMGGAGGDALNGGAGNDTLDGRLGADTMAGGSGNDVYFVDNAGDQVIEAAGGGSDTVFATANFALGAGQEIETLRVSGAAGLALTGNELANYLMGGAGGDALNGGGGNDKLDGRLGADTMAGGSGNDVYFVDNAGDQVIEAAGGGGDTVFATANFALGAGQEIETLRVSGAAGLALTGNELANNLVGGAGGDALNGGAGNDKLDGRLGADTMAGGSGNDVYFVDNAGDRVIEAVGGGSDTVYARVDYALEAGQEVEYLRVSGVVGLALTGNELANYLMGGAGNDTLNGGAGFDRLEGGAGADMLAGGTSFDFASYENSTMGLTVSLALPASNTGEATGDSFISIEGLIGSKYADHLIGNSEVNTLQGMGGADILDGGAGFDYAGYMNAGSGVKASLLNPSENSGDAKGDSYFNIEGLIGSKYNDTLIGDAGNNWLDGREGADYLNGGAGIDAASYFDATVGVYASLANSSLNTGFAAGDSYVLIEGLAGSRHADQLIGDSNNNILTGQGGADVLDGGNGFDYAAYYSATEGVTASLASPAANTGEAAGDSFASIEGLIGSENNDVLIGNSSANRFYGLGGADTFVFNTALGAGNVDVISDFVAGSDRVGLDLTIFSAAGSSGTLGSNAFFAGSAAHDADDRIVYNSTNGQVLYDADGSGAQAGVVFATLATGLAVTANDFFLL